MDTEWHIASLLHMIMSAATLPRFLFLCTLCCALAACGANVESASPALAAHAARTPAADCEPQACQGLRIIDSNAETFRADSARRDALSMAVARLDD